MKFTMLEFLKWILVITIGSGLLGHGILRADDDPELTRPSLKALKPLRVSLRLGGAMREKEGLGVTEDGLRTLVELKLHNAGIAVSSDGSILV